MNKALFFPYLVVERATDEVSLLQTVSGAAVRTDSLECLVVTAQHDGVGDGVKVVQVFPCKGIIIIVIIIIIIVYPLPQG